MAVLSTSGSQWYAKLGLLMNMDATGSAVPYEAVRRKVGLTEQTELQLQALILDKTLRAGDRLPSERDLGEKLGVSKTVIREAIRSLAAHGLVEVRAGSGTYIRQLDQEMMVRPLNFLLRGGGLEVENIHEVRQVLEVSIAGLAALRCKPADLDAMQDTITSLESREITAVKFAEADVAFHRILAGASGNPLFYILAKTLNTVMIGVRLNAYQHNPDSVERAIFYHSNILDRVRAKDPEGARRAMEQHLEYALGVMQRVAASEGARTQDQR